MSKVNVILLKVKKNVIKTKHLNVSILLSNLYIKNANLFLSKIIPGILLNKNSCRKTMILKTIFAHKNEIVF